MAEKVGASIPQRADFDKYFTAINEKIAPANLPLHSELMKLNRLRVQAKHAGIFPSHSQATAMVPVVSAFIEEVCEHHLGTNWATANLSSLVENQEKRELLGEAESALSSRQFTDALIAARKALYLTFEAAYDICRFAPGKPALGLLGAFGCEAPPWAKTAQYIETQVKDPFGYIVIDHADIDSKLFKLGADPIIFWNIWRISPAVYKMEDGRWLVKRELAKVERSDHEADAIYVVENVADMVLRSESQSRRLKLIPQSGAWSLKAKAGARLFAKADAGSEVSLTFAESEFLFVDSETCGFDGEGGWWHVSVIGKGRFTSGFLREDDVDRSPETQRQSDGS
ncbi:MAG: hypothetical protein JSR98_15895 [Proteobacteria bacterium]|nr:hypothetical protein [Pseudomonadota bacterium]